MGRAAVTFPSVGLISSNALSNKVIPVDNRCSMHACIVCIVHMNFARGLIDCFFVFLFVVLIMRWYLLMLIDMADGRGKKVKRREDVMCTAACNTYRAFPMYHALLLHRQNFLQNLPPNFVVVVVNVDCSR